MIKSENIVLGLMVYHEEGHNADTRAEDVVRLLPSTLKAFDGKLDKVEITFDEGKSAKALFTLSEGVTKEDADFILAKYRRVRN